MTSFPPPSVRQARLLWLALTGLSLAVLVAVGVAFIWGLAQVLRLLSPVLWPLAVAGVLAYLLDPIVDLLENRGLRRPQAIVGVFGIALVLVTVFFASIVPQLVEETRQLTRRIPEYAARVEQRVEYWMNHPPPLIQRLLHRESTNAPAEPAPITNAVLLPPPATPPPPNPPLKDQTLQTAGAWLTDALPRIGSWLFGQVGRVASWFGVLAGLALIPVYTFYFLLEKRGISSRWTDYLPVADSKFKTELVFVLEAINNYLITFFRGQVLVAICDGTLYGLGFLIVGLPYAVLIGVMAMFLTMIPFLGAIVTCTTAVVIAIVQFGDWSHPLKVLGVFAFVQALEGLVISPRIMGGRVGLHPVTIIIAVMAGTTLLGGLLGGILAIPLTAALRVIMFRYVWKRERKENEPPAALRELPPLTPAK